MGDVVLRAAASRIFGLAFALFAFASFGEGDAANAAEVIETSAAGTGNDTGGEEDRKPKGWLDGGGFGGGISYTWDIGSDDRIKEADVVAGVVRVLDEQDGIARPMLEAHAWRKKPTEHKIGHGPFIAVGVGSSSGDVVNAIGGGYLWGFEREEGEPGLNLGLGFVMDPDTQILGDGIEANMKLPEGETEVRYKKEAQLGFMLMISYGI